MERTRHGRSIGAGRIDRTKAEATSDDDMRRDLAEAGFDPNDPLTGLRPVVPVAAVRNKTGLSQERFAKALGIPVATLRNWEQGRTVPDPVARSFFKLVEDDPERAFKVLAE